MDNSYRYVTAVCTANICRSPIAERLLAHALEVQEEPLKSLKVASAGVAAMEGYPPSANSVKVLKNVGLDLSDHISQGLSDDLMKHTVLFLCMTESHRYYINNTYPDLKTPVLLMRELLPPPADPQIPDPYGMDLKWYQICFDSMIETIPSIIRYLKENVKS